MGKFDGYLLVVDFDDTFRPYGQREVPEENLQAAAYFMEEGGLFTVATGRDPLSFLSIRDLFTINAPAVLSNGAVLFDPESGEDLYESFLPFSCRRDLTALLEAFPEIGLEIIRGTDVRVVRSNTNLEHHLRAMGAEVHLTDMDRILFPWTKAAVILPGDLHRISADAHAVISWLEEHCPGAYDAVASGAIVDIAAAGNNKGTGVEKLAGFMDIPRERVVCVGDSWNDLPMLRFAGHSFAPENALDEVKGEPGVIIVGPCFRCLADVVDHLENEK